MGVMLKMAFQCIKPDARTVLFLHLFYCLSVLWDEERMHHWRRCRKYSCPRTTRQTSSSLLHSIFGHKCSLRVWRNERLSQVHHFFFFSFMRWNNQSHHLWSKRTNIVPNKNSILICSFKQWLNSSMLDVVENSCSICQTTSHNSEWS